MNGERQRPLSIMIVTNQFVIRYQPAWNTLPRGLLGDLEFKPLENAGYIHGTSSLVLDKSSYFTFNRVLSIDRQ